jgi:hypothetical protein
MEMHMPAPGYLGLGERTIDVGIDWTLVETYGPCVVVVSRSPAMKAGLRSSDYIISINGVRFDEFHKAIPPAGTRFEIVAWRKNLGEIRVFGTLANVAKTRLEQAEQSPTVPAGKRVSKTERPVFIGFISDHPNLHAIDVRLLLVIIERDWGDGTIQSRSALANRLGRSIRSVDRATLRCRQAGVLRVRSGKARCEATAYFVTWPANHERSRRKDAYAKRAIDPEAQAFADQLIAITGLTENPNAVKTAATIVEQWFAKGWQRPIITKVVQDIMQRQRPALNSLRYSRELLLAPTATSCPPYDEGACVSTDGHNQADENYKISTEAIRPLLSGNRDRTDSAISKWLRMCDCALLKADNCNHRESALTLPGLAFLPATQIICTATNADERQRLMRMLCRCEILTRCGTQSPDRVGNTSRPFVAVRGWFCGSPRAAAEKRGRIKGRWRTSAPPIFYRPPTFPLPSHRPYGAMSATLEADMTRAASPMACRAWIRVLILRTTQPASRPQT